MKIETMRQMEDTMNRIHYHLSSGFIWIILGIFFFTAMIVDGCSEPRAKYTVYAAGRHYSCNQFQITGNTIYFTDTEHHNVCISGQFTLIYETQNEK